LIGLDKIDTHTCNPKGGIEACADLNLRFHTAGQCLAYQCASDGAGCTLRPRDEDADGYADATSCGAEVDAHMLDCDDTDPDITPNKAEVCDGKDNDCNGIVDDGVMSLANRATREISLPISQHDTNYALAPVNGAGPGPLFSIRSGGNAWLIGQSTAGAPLTSTLRYHYACDSDLSDDASCPGPAGPEGCAFDDLALAAAGSRTIAAAVTQAGGTTRLRIGPVSMRGADTEVELGVGNKDDYGMRYGVEAETACSCAALDVDQPVIEALPASGEDAASALVVWRANFPNNAGTSSCGSAQAAPLKALLVWVRDGDANTADALLASDGGHPRCFANSASDGPVGLVATGSGFVAGYPNAARQLELAVFGHSGLPSALRQAPRLDSLKCQELNQAALAADSCDASSDVPTLPSPTLQTFDELGGAVEQVALAWGGVPGDPATPRSLLIAFRAGCAEQAQIRMLIVQIADAAGDPSLAHHAGVEAIALTTANRARGVRDIVSGPSVGYVSDGFLAPSMTGAHDTLRGGWFVLWTEQRATDQVVVGMRVSEQKHVPLEKEPFVLLSDTKLASLQMTRQNDQLLFGLVKQDTAQLSIGSMQCR
jgi:hypothetical protein